MIFLRDHHLPQALTWAGMIDHPHGEIILMDLQDPHHLGIILIIPLPLPLIHRKLHPHLLMMTLTSLHLTHPLREAEGETETCGVATRLEVEEYQTEVEDPK